MRTSNLANEAMRQAETGQIWEEVLTNAQGTVQLKPYQTFRVRAAGATTITIDSTLAMTMSSGEIVIFNAGSGQPDASGMTKQASQVVVVVAGAAAFVQVARDNVRKVQ